MKLAYIDLFCGAGGMTTGIHLSGKGRVLACVNHDAEAIKAHEANHPATKHYIEDVRRLVLRELVEQVKEARRGYPEVKIVLHASCDCTHFSKAKGSQPRDAKLRSLPRHLYRYIEALKPDYVSVENVPEFQTWGPLQMRENGLLYPVKEKEGIYYEAWKRRIENMGYSYDFRIFNAVDFGSYSLRTRYFCLFAKGDLKHKWPEPRPELSGKVGDVLDLEDIGTSIFDRSPALCDNTIRRYRVGLEKFIGEGSAYLVNYFSGGGQVTSLNDPAPAVTTVYKSRVVVCQFVDQQYGKSLPKGLDKPNGAVTTNPHNSLVSACVGKEDRSRGKPGDSEEMHLLKAVMRYHGVTDIYSRLFSDNELKRLMGFPEDYQLVGTKTTRRKHLGAAVHVDQAKALCNALAE